MSDQQCCLMPLFNLKEIIFLNILEVFIGSVLQFIRGIFITDNDGMGMLLQAADSPHVVDWLFNTMTEGTCLVMTIHHDHNLLGIHHSADTNCKRGLRNLVNVIIKETAVSNHCILVSVFWRVRLVRLEPGSLKAI